MSSIIAQEVNIEIATEQILFKKTNKELAQLHKILTKYYGGIEILGKSIIKTPKKDAIKKAFLNDFEKEITTQVDIILQQLGEEFDVHIHPDFPDEWANSISTAEIHIKGVSQDATAEQERIASELSIDDYKEVLSILSNMLTSCKIAQKELNFKERQFQNLTITMRRLHANLYFKKNEEMIRQWWTGLANDISRKNSSDLPRFTTSSELVVNNHDFSHNGIRSDIIKIRIYYTGKNGIYAFILSYIPEKDIFEIENSTPIQSTSLATALEKMATIACKNR